MIMKKYGLITKVLLISMFAILLSGCGNLLTSEFSSKTDETKFYTITGNIDVDAISAENSSRTGLPTIPSINDNSIYFSVSATKDGDTITGTVTGNQYSITLPKGSWTITVIGEKAGVKVLEGSITVNTEDEPTTQQTITLKTINAGTGSLSLTISISKEENLSCGGVKATLYKNSGEESNDVKYLKFNDTDNNLIQLGFNDLPAGTYSIDLEFYQEMTSSTTTEGTYSCKNLLYSHHDTVNIFANLVTNTWTGSGYSEDKTTFTLTKAMITNFAMTTFYVSNSGDDSKAGTYFAPFATLQAAVNKVTEMNKVSSSNENAPYRILLLSNIEDTSTGEDICDGSLISIKNYPNPELYLKIASYQNDSCFEIKGASGRRIMNIEEGANVTIENITLTGGNINANGGGVYVANKAIFTMGNGATISNCTGDNGGGVYVQSGIFIMNSGAKINGCKAEGEYAGGGVYLNGGTFTMNGGTISGCTAEQGGGVCIFGGELIMNEGATISTCTSLLYGGGVVVYGSEGVNSGAGGTFNMAGGTISGCSAEQGGGVYVEKVTFTMTGGTISENKADCGGGIYLTGTAQLIMTGGKISGNHPKDETSSNTFGGGVHISGESSIFAMTGGEISGNSAKYGGGVTVDGSFFMSGGTISGNEVTNNSNGNGSGVYVAYSGNSLSAATFEMSGGAVISLGNDVYLATEAFIKVTGNLTSTDTVATITPNEYSINRQVITVPVNDDGATSSVTLSDQVGKFAVTPQTATDGATINWYINAEGKIAKENAYYVSNIGSDNEGVTGSKDAPFATMQKAVETINGINDGTSPYTIYVMNDITGTDSDFTDDNKALINVVPGENKSLNLKICGFGNEKSKINAGRNVSQTGRVMYIGKNANVTLQNLILTGGYLVNTNSPAAAYRGAGLYILNSTAEVTIKNCEISENVIDNGYGAGLCVGYLADESLNLTIENSKISNNTIKHDSNGALSQAGAGIDIENVAVTLTITNSEISENKIDQNTCSSGEFNDYGVGLCLGNRATTKIFGTTIKNNKIENAALNNENAGGGVYLNGGTLTIQNSTENYTVISGNSSTIGGGVYVSDGTFTMNGGTISGCSASEGGGVCILGGELIMNSGATISNCTGEYAGGIIIYTGGTFTMNDKSTISECTSLSYGGGVTVYSSDNDVQVSGGTFNMAGGTISDCTVEYGCGGGVYVEKGTFTMNGGAVISSNNDVYLANGTTITVTGNLTSTDTVATITPDEYSATRQVLVAGSTDGATSSVTLSEQVGKFAVTPQVLSDGHEYWFIDPYGYLGKVPKIETNDDGTDVYLMESYDNLLYIAQELKTGSITSFNMKLTKDIEIPSGKWTSPLDVTNASTIDGQGHSIKFNGGSGLFERFHEGSIENLVLEGTINTSSYQNHHNGHCGVGVLAGSTYKTTIKNVVSTVDVVDTGNGYVGGLIGYFGGNSNMDEWQPGSFIQNCAVYANITSTNGTVGGLVGGTWAGAQCWQINNCIYAGTVDGGTDQGVGAIIGTHNTGRTSTFKDTWYYANGTSKIVGKYNNEENGENFNGYETVISKNAEEITSEAAATLLGDAWKYVSGGYPTLKSVN